MKKSCKKCGQVFNGNYTHQHDVACKATPPPAELAQMYIDENRPGIYKFARRYDVSDYFMKRRLVVGMKRLKNGEPIVDKRRSPPLVPADVPRCDRCTLLIHSDREMDIGLCHYCIEEVEVAWQS